MATEFEAGHVTTPRTTIVADLRELWALHAAGAVGFPCVVKPADGAGSAGVTVVTGPEELEPAWHAARAASVMYGMPCDERILVQEHVLGREFSVESVTQHEVTTHLCITRKHTTDGIHRVELGHALPACLPAAAERALLEEAGRAIAAVGVRNGATRTELALGPDGRCTVLEIGARLGAGHIGVLMQHALGIDPWRTAPCAHRGSVDRQHDARGRTHAPRPASPLACSAGAASGGRRPPGGGVRRRCPAAATRAAYFSFGVSASPRSSNSPTREGSSGRPSEQRHQ